jgi:TatD DNase family protein
LIAQGQDGTLTGVFHCFTGNVKQAARIIELGFFLGIGGVSTFKNGGLESVLKDIPLASVLLETDSPYLAPVPHRGKRNEPAYTSFVLNKVAEAKGIPVETVAADTTSNAIKLFRL